MLSSVLLKSIREKQSKITSKNDFHFNKTEDPESKRTLGTAYDYYSIMHYKWNAFAIDSEKPTIKIRKDGIDSRILGTKSNLSSTDIVRINRLYKCPNYAHSLPKRQPLLIVRGKAIIRSNLFGNFLCKAIFDSSDAIFDTAFDCRHKRIVWNERYIDANSRSYAVIRSAFINGTDQKELLSATSRKNPERLVVDRSLRNVYYTGVNEIGVVSLDGKYQKTIAEFGSSTQLLALALERIDRHLFFCQSKRMQGSIERIDLDGSNRMTFVDSSDVEYVTGLVTLSRRRELCWMNKNQTYYMRLSCVGLDQSNRRVVHTRDVGHRFSPICLTVLNEERFYWTVSPADEKVHSVSIDGNDYASFEICGTGPIFGIAALEETCFGAETECAVNNGGCRYLCLPKSGGGVRCVCPDNVKDLVECKDDQDLVEIEYSIHEDLEDITWPNAVVPFFITSSINGSLKLRIKNAMQIIESASCIKFRERERRKDRYFIRIFARHGYECSSEVGMSYGDQYSDVGQPLRLDDGCSDMGTILHELIHALGFRHEIDRADRDEYVEIMYDNIHKKYHHNFNKTEDPESKRTLGTAYDYYSIMHFKWNAFAIDPEKPTIKIKKDGMFSRILGTNSNLSSTDIVRINRLYKCPNYDANPTQ